MWTTRLLSSLITALLITRANASAPGTAVLAPMSRTLHPVSIYRKTGNVTISAGSGPAAVFQLCGANATVTYDFGQMVAGIPTISLSNPSCYGGKCVNFSLPSLSCGLLCQGLGLAYTESVQFVSVASDNSILYSQNDGTVFLPLNGGANYTVPSKWGRGSFRYLTLSLGSSTDPHTSVSIHFDSLHYTASPDIKDETKLAQYSGYCSSSDAQLNRIWQAGAYTLQLCTVAANSSVNHVYVALGSGWANDATATTLTSTDAFLSDGAKRDRNPWAGDAAIGLRSALVSRNIDNLRAVRLTLQEIIILQNKNALSAQNGFFPYAGSPLGDLLIAFPTAGIAAYGSDTYHLWTIVGYVEYLKVTRDYGWANRYWQQIINGLVATYKFIDPATGLYNGTGTQDWGRAFTGGQNIALNALYYHALELMVNVAPSMQHAQGVNVTKWTAIAAHVKASANRLLFDPMAGLYQDNTTSVRPKVYPQDGNSFAIAFNLTETAAQQATIAKALARRHTSRGAPAPELPGSISPFISSFELYAQFAVAAQQGNASVPLDFMRTMWGFMMHQFSNSTFVEGYATDGTLAYGFYPNGENFTSHTHGWSTGPVYSLVHDVVGIQSTSIDIAPADGDWIFRPLVIGSGLTNAIGGFSTLGGAFEASWQILDGCREFVAEMRVPVNLTGSIYVPTFGLKARDAIVQVDQKTLNVSCGAPYHRISGLKGGKHSMRVQAKDVLRY